MPYDENEAAESEMDAAKGLEEKPAAESGDSSFFLPSDVVAAIGSRPKPGDTLTFKVVGEDRDGGIEVQLQPQEKKEDWRSDLHQTMSAPTEIQTAES